MTYTTDKPEKFRMGEQGYLGLRSFDGRVLEHKNKDLQFPYSIRTFKDMVYDPSISSAITAINDVVRGVTWSVEEGESKERAEFIESCMEDMTHTWDEFITNTLTILQNGFQVSEKVFKYRQGEKNNVYTSKYDDGLVGWAKLAPRSADTLDKWLWSEDGRELIGVRQNLGLVPNETDLSRFPKTEIRIPRKKFLLFRHDGKDGNPQGTSPLVKCYVPWKYKIEIENQEAAGVCRQFTGMPVFWSPPEYFAEDADEDKVRYRQLIESAIVNMSANEQAGLHLPQFHDDNGNKLFDFDLKTVSGNAVYDTNQIVDRYESKILMAFLADVLKLGQSSVGSFALADAKTNLLAIRIASILKQIVDVINNDLIPHTFKMNGWKDKKLPKIVHSDLEELSLDELGKFIQRVVSVGATEVDKEFSGLIRKRIRLSEKPTEPLDDKFLANNESKASEGMKTSGEGTSKTVGGKDTSSSNSENKASSYQYEYDALTDRDNDPSMQEDI